MTLAQQRAQAYLKAEDAIQELADAYGLFDQGEILTGWTIVISGSRFSTPTLDDGVTEADDELDVTAHYGYHTRRGQDPTMTRGMLESLIDKFRAGD